MLEPKEEILITAEKALRDLSVAANEAGKEISASFVYYTAQLALNKIQALKQKERQ